MFYHPYYDDKNEPFLSIVCTLGLTGHEKDHLPDDIAQLQMRMIEKLENAPFTEQVDRALLLGLRNSERQIVNRTTTACLKRLLQIPDEKYKADFIGLILDACFLNLSGRKLSKRGDSKFTENRTIIELDLAASQLFDAVTKEILSKPLEYSHHISRILSRARRIQHIEGVGPFAEAVVKFQNLLCANHARVYHKDASNIQRQRKFNLYISPTSSEATLLANLNEDSKLRVQDISQELIRMYRILLNVQTKRRLILKTLENLISWLMALPSSDSLNWEFYVNEMVNRARIGEAWEALDLNVVRHLEIQFELLPGQE
ncbi:MAG: hypothetical protein PVI90_12585, partial [Desulfobacteraceae bacterium]